MEYLFNISKQAWQPGFSIIPYFLPATCMIGTPCPPPWTHQPRGRPALPCSSLLYSPAISASHALSYISLSSWSISWPLGSWLSLGPVSFLPLLSLLLSSPPWSNSVYWPGLVHYFLFLLWILPTASGCTLRYIYNKNLLLNCISGWSCPHFHPVSTNHRWAIPNDLSGLCL